VKSLVQHENRVSLNAPQENQSIERKPAINSRSPVAYGFPINPAISETLSFETAILRTGGQLEMATFGF